MADIGLIGVQHQFLIILLLLAQSQLFELTAAQTLIVVMLHGAIEACQRRLIAAGLA